MQPTDVRIFVLPLLVTYHALKEIVKTEEFDDLCNSVFSYIIGQGGIREYEVQVKDPALIPVLRRLEELQEEHLAGKAMFKIFEGYENDQVDEAN